MTRQDELLDAMVASLETRGGTAELAARIVHNLARAHVDAVIDSDEVRIGLALAELTRRIRAVDEELDRQAEALRSRIERLEGLDVRTKIIEARLRELGHGGSGTP